MAQSAIPETGTCGIQTSALILSDSLFHKLGRGLQSSQLFEAVAFSTSRGEHTPTKATKEILHCVWRAACLAMLQHHHRLESTERKDSLSSHPGGAISSNTSMNMGIASTPLTQGQGWCPSKKKMQIPPLPVLRDGGGEGGSAYLS